MAAAATLSTAALGLALVLDVAVTPAVAPALLGHGRTFVGSGRLGIGIVGHLAVVPAGGLKGRALPALGPRIGPEVLAGFGPGLGPGLSPVFGPGFATEISAGLRPGGDRGRLSPRFRLGLRPVFPGLGRLGGAVFRRRRGCGGGGICHAIRCGCCSPRR